MTNWGRPPLGPGVNQTGQMPIYLPLKQEYFMAKDNFYNKLTRLFRSGPSIQRKIKGYDAKAIYDKALLHNNLG